MSRIIKLFLIDEPKCPRCGEEGYFEDLDVEVGKIKYTYHCVCCDMDYYVWE